MLVKVEGHRWAIEDGFETAKNELGLDHNETRSWHGWHRHVSFVMLAFTMLAVIRHYTNAPTAPKISIRLARKHQTSSAGRSRNLCRIAVRLAHRRIQPAHVIASSLWRPAHQAAARRAHLKQ